MSIGLMELALVAVIGGFFLVGAIIAIVVLLKDR